MAFVVALDAIRRIGEVDGAVGGDDDIVGAVEALALVFVGEDRDRPVVLGAGDAAVAMLTADQAAAAAKVLSSNWAKAVS